MFGVIQECSRRPKYLPKGNKKNETSVPPPEHNANISEALETLAKEKIVAKYDKHNEKKSYEREINKRFQRRLQEYEESIEKRREKLRDMLWKDERELYREVVESTQRAQEERFEEMKATINAIKSQEEFERQELVKEKRFQQYLNKCDEFRPVLANRRLHETKEVNLVQIREHEKRKLEEKEAENIWYAMLLKNIREATEREEEEKRAIKQKQQVNRETWQAQWKFKEIKEQDKLREMREDLIKMNNEAEKQRKEEIAKLDEKRRKREEHCKYILKQIKEKEEVLRKEQEYEQQYANIFEKEREKNEISSKSKEKAANLKKEMDQYMDYLALMEVERKAEQKRIDELVEKELMEIQKKQDDAQCKYKLARENLNKTVNEELQKQIKYRQEAAEQQLKMKEAENDLIRVACKQNERLRAEYERQKLLAEQQYKEDLNKQMEYKKLQKEREKEELDRLLAKGLEEEEEYKEALHKILNSDIKVSEEHPFRKVMNKKLDYHKFF